MLTVILPIHGLLIEKHLIVCKMQIIHIPMHKDGYIKV